MVNCCYLRKLVITTAFLATAWTTAPARAVLLDWNSQTWPSGGLSSSFDVDPANTGTDVTIAITGNTNILATPTVNNTIQGGFGTSQNSLLFHLDSTTPTDAITITISFSAQYTQGVTNISFTLASIDKNSYRDRVTSISGLGIDGTTTFAPTITNVGSAVSLNGAGLNQQLVGNAAVPDSGTGSGAGNATINFTGYGIGSVTFRLDNGAAFPSAQNFALFNVSFTPVPEVTSWVITGALCAGLAALRLRRTNVTPRRDAF